MNFNILVKERLLQYSKRGLFVAESNVSITKHLVKRIDGRCERRKRCDSLTRNCNLLSKGCIYFAAYIDSRVYTNALLRTHVYALVAGASRTHPEMHQADISWRYAHRLIFYYSFSRIRLYLLPSPNAWNGAHARVADMCTARARATRTHIIMPKRYSRKRAFAWYIRGYMRDGVYVLPHDIRVIIRLAPAILRWCMAGPASYIRCPKLHLYSFRQVLAIFFPSWKSYRDIDSLCSFLNNWE